MLPLQFPRLQLPPSHAVLLVLALAFVAPGLVGHDPWRAFDVIAISRHNALSGRLLCRAAGPVLAEDPPFSHWLALAFAKLSAGARLPIAARLASGAECSPRLFSLSAARHSALRR